MLTHDSGSLASELVFGSIDGIFSVLGIIAAAATASLTALQIFTTGLGGAAAGALSVFAATYLSKTHEKKTRLLSAWENSKAAVKRSRNSDSKKRDATKREHAHFHRLLAKTNRRAILSGIVTSGTSTLASLALLFPFVMLSETYSVTASIFIGIFLLALLGAFRGMSLRQSAAKSAIKMVILGVIIIVASRSLAAYVVKLF